MFRVVKKLILFLALISLQGDVFAKDLILDDHGQEVLRKSGKIDANGDVNIRTQSFITGPSSGNQAEVNASGQLLTVLDGKVSPENSSSTPLSGGASFTGTAVEILDYGIVFVTVFANVASATDGLSIQISPDGTNWDNTDDYTIPANKGKTFSTQPSGKWLRVVYTNGGAGQAVGGFRLQTVLKKTNSLASSHRISDSISQEDDASLQKSVLTGLGDLSETFDNVTTYRGVLNINSAWVHRKIVNETFHQNSGGSTTLNAAASEGDTSIVVVDTAGIIVGDEIKLEDNSVSPGLQEIGLMTVTVVAAGTPGTLTLDRPLGNDYTTSATVDEVISNMAVSGTLGTPQIFHIDAPAGTVWQVTRILISMTHKAAADDSKYGSIAALTNGVALIAVTSAGRTVTYANWKNNGDMKLDMYDVVYTDRAGVGVFGTNGRWTFTRSEVVAELDGDATGPVQQLFVYIQDDLTTGSPDLFSFTIRAQGRVFRP